jgi:hypothetical protein
VAAEGFPRIEVGPAAVLETTGHLGEAQDNGQHAKGGDQMGERALDSGQGRDLGGHAEDRAANDAIHDGEGEVGARNGADGSWGAHAA